MELAAQPASDFGRPQESIFVEEFLPWLRDGIDSLTGQSVPASPYTDESVRCAISLMRSSNLRK
jgi:hypothetical protein